jgi:UDP:flavonoid glycosyltransferase YjiC (YdhE family)
MRVLFSCIAAYGHFHPLVPLARAFADEGHDVAFATSASFADRVHRAGFDLLPAGIDQDELERRFAPVRAHLRTLPVAERRPLAFAGRFAANEAPVKLHPLREIVAEWQPALVVHESGDLAAPIVAAAAGLPSVHHSFGRLIPTACFERAAPEIDPLWRELGLEPEPLCGAYRGTYADLCPPSFQSTTPPQGIQVEPVRPLFPAAVGETAPAWLAGRRGRPLIYVTLGTVHNDVSVFRTLLDGLEGVDCDVLATVGNGNDPLALEPVPANALVERYVPQAYVLPHAAVVVAHGGSGSILATFAHGLPTLLLPQAADQFDNAARCAEIGAGLVLLPGDVTAEAVREAAETLLAEPAYGDRAAELAEEVAAMPHPAEVARRLVARVGS